MREILEVKSPKDNRLWIQYGSELYKNYPKYVPHLKQDIEKVFNPEKNRAFKTGKAIRWLAFDDQNRVIGKIAAFTSKKYSKGMEQPTGGIGFFECIEDEQTAHALFNKAIAWLKSENMEAVDGLINFGEKDAYWGTLITNFNDKNCYRMNHHLPYYKDFMESYGFKTYYEQLVYYRDMHLPVQEIFNRKSNFIDLNSDFRTENCRGKSLSQISEDFLTVYNNAWGGHHGFAPMKKAQADRIMKAMKPIMDRDILIFTFHKNKPIGFYINIPELNDIFKFVNGNLNLIGKLKFLWHKWRKTSTMMVGIVFGVDREYHGKGIEAALIKFAEENVVTAGVYHESVMTWIGDFNPKMIKVCENLGAEVYRKLATYRFLFDRNQEFKRAPIAK